MNDRYKSLGGINVGQEKKSGDRKQALSQIQLKQIQELANTIRYGSINLVFQDGILIQIDKSEKIRIPKT